MAVFFFFTSRLFPRPSYMLKGVDEVGRETWSGAIKTADTITDLFSGLREARQLFLQTVPIHN